MKTLKQKQLEFLEETVNFFNLKNRCTKEGGECQYFVKGKEGCAIGRKIKDKELCKKLDYGLCNGLYTAVTSNIVFNILPKNLKELGQSFLIEIQSLHDNKRNWTDTGLSEKGKERVETIKNSFCL